MGTCVCVWMLQVLNRSMDPRNPEQPEGQLTPALITQLSPTPIPITMPQNFITHGTRRDCIRMRNLPPGAQVTDILTFLAEYAQFIQYQGVHMVFTAQVSLLLVLVVHVYNFALLASFCMRSLQAHLHVVGMLRFMFLT